MDQEILKNLATKDDIQKLDKKIDGLEKRMDGLEKRMDKLSIMAVNNQAEIKKMVTKDEFNERFDQIMVGQDKIITILQRLDQERIFTIEWIKRIEGDVERNRKDIERIKGILKIA